MFITIVNHRSSGRSAVGTPFPAFPIVGPPPLSSLLASSVLLHQTAVPPPKKSEKHKPSRAGLALRLLAAHVPSRPCLPYQPSTSFLSDITSSLPSSDYVEVFVQRAGPEPEAHPLLANPRDRAQFLAALHRYASQARFDA